MNLDTSIVSNKFSVKISNKMTNGVDLDERARDEPSHLDLHCLQSYCIGL